MTTDELRAKFEAWWTLEIGSLDFRFGWSNAWLAWQAAHASRDAEVESMKADRDSWAEQASERVRDWDEMRQRAEKSEAERDALKPDAEIGRYVLKHAEWIRDEDETLMAIRFAGHVDLSSVGTRRDAIDAAMQEESK